VEATGPDGAVVDIGTNQGNSCSATDNADPSPTITYAGAPPGNLFPIGISIVTCTATDSSGNSATATFNVTVQDTTAPIIAAPNSITVEATGPDGAVVKYDPCVASDIADPSPTISYSSPSGSTFPIGTTHVVCTATDTSGNTATATFNVIVQDTTKPSVTCSITPNKLSLPANNHKLVTVNATVVVKDDNSSGPDGFTLVSVTSNQDPSGLGPDDVPNDFEGWSIGEPDTQGQLRAERYGTNRIYTITYEGKDKAGNRTTCSATVTVPKPTNKKG
jgi:hypothetical protein